MLLNGDSKLNDSGDLILLDNSYENNIQLITKYILKIKTNIQIGYRFCFNFYCTICCASLVAQLVKNPTCHAGDPGSIPRLGRSAGEGIGSKTSYILFYFIKFCWEH